MTGSTAVKLEGEQYYVQCSVCQVVAVAENQTEAINVTQRHFNTHPNHYDITAGNGKDHFNLYQGKYKRVNISTL